MRLFRVLPAALLAGTSLVGLAAFAAAPAGNAGDDGFRRALAALSAKRISARIRFLSDDLLEGRGTGARGSEIAARYIATEFSEDGLRPAGDGDSYLQNFEMIGVSTDPASRVTFETPGEKIELENGRNSVLSTRNQKPTVALDAPVVFIGYGITAPDMKWDDYRDF